MAFSKERITDADFQKYKVARTPYGNEEKTFEFWAIDREREIYLRQYWADWQHPSNDYWWFYWGGVQGQINTTTLSYIGETVGRASAATIRVWVPFVFQNMLSDSIAQNSFIDAYRTHYCVTRTSTVFEFT